MKFTCFSWNTAKRFKLLDDQFEFIIQTHPDIVALQEITLNTEQKFKELLKTKFRNVISSFDFVDDKSVLKKNRMFGQLLATNYSVELEEQKQFKIPWKERVLSVKIYIKEQKIKILLQQKLKISFLFSLQAIWHQLNMALFKIILE